LFFVLLSSCSSEFESDNKSVVVEVIDGDTVKLDNGEVVRLLGVDAPERGEEGYYAAMYRLGELVEDNGVILVTDINSSNRDKYGRLLRYVYIEDSNESVNDILLREGYVEAYKK
jgi:micrococcal nuclease